jgi:fermentation-respiration switch protein FrsA (DUF1100 family)
LIHSALRIFLYAAILVVGVRLLLPFVVFRPTSEVSVTPRDYGLAYEDVTIMTSDGVDINGWFVPSENARANLIFFHGNAGNISHRMDSIGIFHGLGLSVLIIDYRGYGKSGGRVSISGTALDAAASWRWLAETKNVPADEVVVFGRSLGGAVAVGLMRDAAPRALILESTFSSLADMIGVPFLKPLVRLVTGDRWDSAGAASSITTPALCIHSPDDEIVPYRLGRRLNDALAGEKSFLEIRGSHNGGFLESAVVYIPALDAFLTKYFGPY